MIPSVEDIIKRRHTVLIILRFASLTCLVLFPIPVVSWLLEGFRDADLFDFYYYGVRIGVAVALVVCSAICRFCDRPLARWIVPIPKPQCPTCGYPIKGLRRPMCPECGGVLPQAYAADEMSKNAADEEDEDSGGAQV